jgi:orotate phosphoribosyltransferase
VSEPATGQLDVRAVLERWGAIEEGHFELTSGRHSNRYVQKARVLERPEVAMELAREVASWYPVIDVVVSPAVGAIPFGFAVALAAGARSIFAERVDGAMALRRGFVLEAGERALVVEDVVTTGGSAREVVELVRASGAESLGVAALVDRAATALPFPLRALVRVEAVAWTRDECPLCRAGVALDAPGSRHL